MIKNFKFEVKFFSLLFKSNERSEYSYIGLADSFDLLRKMKVVKTLI